MNIEKKVEGLIDTAVNKSYLFGLLMKLLRFVGISTFLRKLWLFQDMKKDMCNPTEQMINSSRFFEEHKKEVDDIKNLLEDMRSVSAYEKAIKYRITHDTNYAGDYSIKDQYFPKDIIHLSSEEVFVDCGAFDGDTLAAFRKYSGNKFKQVICFEPDTQNFKGLLRSIGDDNRIIPIKKGVWNENTIISFSENGGTDSKVLKYNDSSQTVEVIKLDDCDACKAATFIKMDIEGAEMNALLGAEMLIRKNRPKLAICIYHSDEDYVRLIKWIDDLNLDYKFYVRNHSFDITETVLYAI